MDYRADIPWLSLIAVIATAAFSGCGGSNETSPRTASDASGRSAHRSAPRVDRTQYLKRAEAICSRSTRDTRALGRKLPQVFSRSSSAQEAITIGLVKPGIEILSRQASDLRGLGPAPNSRALKVYLGLFDPIIALARERLRAGTADEPERAHSLELMISGLGNEQSAAARRFGLRACSVYFTRALGGSA
jgi:hypothetical protein